MSALILAILMGFLAVAIWGAATDGFDDLEYHGMWLTIVCAVSILIFMSFGAVIGATCTAYNAETRISRAQATCELYENSISDESMTGMDRFQIVQMANDTNDDIAEMKASASRWWAFDLPQRLKDQIAELEFID
jgi:nitrogen fixation-related uncharacterized protein